MIIVFGKEGQLARELGRGKNITCIGRQSCDLLKTEKYKTIIKDHNVTGVINASGFTNVREAENSRDEAMRLNCLVPLGMLLACKERNIPFIHISTDYVFDGKKKSAYVEEDLTAPLGVYGKSKLQGEELICQQGDMFAIIRTSWIFSEYGSNFAKTIIQQQKSQKELNVVDDQIGGPTPVKALATACLDVLTQIKKTPKLSGIYHFSGIPSVSWANFAQEILNLIESKSHLNKISTSQLSNNINRPLNSKLDCTKILKSFNIKQPNWKHELSRVVRKLIAEAYYEKK